MVQRHIFERSFSSKASQGRGIGTELMRRLLARVEHLYMVDLCCDADLEPFYRRLGFRALERGMRHRG